ncbi:MAG: SM-20-related protein [Hyphomicrobiaceae bacterium]
MATTHQAPSPLGNATQIAETLDKHGWAVFDDFITPADTVLLAAEAELALVNGNFHAAGIGRGDSFRIDENERRDHVLWLEPNSGTQPQRRFAANMELLRTAINERLFLGLFELETHFSAYHDGDFYKTHIDRFSDTDERTISFIVYLNPNWLDGDGGVLRLYMEEADHQPWVDIEPKGSRIVCFLAEQFAHEVLPVSRRRLGLTGWLSKRH